MLIMLVGLLCIAAAPLGFVLWLRNAIAVKWRNELVAYEMQMPANLSATDGQAWLSNIQARTHPSKLSLYPLRPVCWEVVSNVRGIFFYVMTSKSAEANLLASLRGSLAGARITAAPDYLTDAPTFRVAAEATTTADHRPLAVTRVEPASAALLASLQPIAGPNTEIRLQWIFVSGGTPEPVRSSFDANGQGALAIVEQSGIGDAEAVQAARIKHREPILLGVARVGVAAPTKARAQALFGRVWSTLHGLNAPGVRLRRRFIASADVAARLTQRKYPIASWPVTFNATEGVGLLGFPIGGLSLPGMAFGTARQLPAAYSMPTHGQVIAMSNYPTSLTRPLALTAKDRTQHTYLVGQTGTGKSVLLSRMILNDIRAGYGVFACDPKGDLIGSVLERIDSQTAKRIIVLDASKREQPIGLNILGNAHTEQARELAVDNILHIFREIWASYWGPRTDQILRAALNALIHVPARDGSAMTICEVVPLLTNPSFRRYVTSHPRLPEHYRAYWERFDQLSENDVLQQIGSVLNKVEAFTQRIPIRLMLGQSAYIDFEDIFRRGSVVLVNLAKGDIGTETGNLLGALLISELWRATLNRVKIAPERRKPCFAYIDEAQDIVRLPLPIADMLAQARGFGLGITLANQYLSQLPEVVRAAVLGTVPTRIAFAVEHDDAKLLERRFGPLTADDLTGLAPYELAMRPCVHGQTLPSVTGVSLPPEPPISDAAAIASLSREQFGVARHIVEEAMTRRITQDQRNIAPVGRQKREGSA